MSTPAPASWTLHHGDGWKVLPMLKERGERFNAFVTDPPYSSGGMFRGDRNMDVLKKYVQDEHHGKYANVGFGGDNRDQRAFFRYCVEWLIDLHELSEPGAVLLTFIDWRQIPIMTDAIQCAGWVWRGVMPWDKTEASRPQRGFYRAQCEYILTATHGSIGKEQTRESGVCAPGIFRHAVGGQDKVHPTGKPVALMRDLLSILPPGSRVLDPFAGGGATGLAAAQLGIECMMVEKEAHWCQVIRQRMAEFQPQLI